MQQIISVFFLSYMMITCCLPGVSIVRANEIPKTQMWVEEAKELTNELEVLANRMEGLRRKLRENLEYNNYTALGNLVPKRTKIFLKLWKVTGSPPLLDKELPYVDDKKNVHFYRKFIEDNKELSSEALHRIGLKKCQESLKTPLWRYAVDYAANKTTLSKLGLIPSWEVYTNPPGMLHTDPLTQKSRDRLAKAYSKWLESNDEQFIWDVRANCFYPKSGKYKNTAGLANAIMNTKTDTVETSRAIKVWENKQIERMNNQKQEEIQKAPEK